MRAVAKDAGLWVNKSRNSVVRVEIPTSESSVLPTFGPKYLTQAYPYVAVLGINHSSVLQWLRFSIPS
jgi:hypothetical protein